MKKGISTAHKRAAWSYMRAGPRQHASPASSLFDPDEVEAVLGGKRLVLAPGQTVIPHGIERGLDPGEILKQATWASSWPRIPAFRENCLVPAQVDLWSISIMWPRVRKRSSKCGRQS